METVMNRVLNLREGGSERECFNQWEDHFTVMKLLAELYSCNGLVATFDVRLKEQSARNVPASEFVSLILRSIRHTTDSRKKGALN